MVDVVVLYLAASAALFANGSKESSATDHLLAAAFPLVVLAILHVRRDPDERLNGSMLDTAANVLGVVSLSAMLIVALDSMLGDAHPVALALRLWLFSLVYLGVARLVLLSLRHHAMRSEAFATPTLIVGAGVVGEHLVKRLVGEPRYGLRPVGFLDSDPLLRPDHSAPTFVPVLGGPEQLRMAVEQTGARQVILAFSSEPDHVLVETVNECQRLGVEVALVPRLYESINERSTLDHIGGVPLLSLHPTNPRGWQFAVKHAFDRTFALIALVALAPLMIALAIGVKLSSPGPVCFRQRRVGRDGRTFDVLKFRTMRESRSTHEFELLDGCAPGGVEGEDRRTGFGQWLRGTSLDELPQFINVLRGNMSLVGPRPERPEFVERFSVEVDRYKDRHRVKSGITGWAQVNGLRGQTSIADRVEWDNYYIQNWSLRLDLRIIALTIAEVLRFRG
ncbi:MAG TPA: sugar transferase [Solirubrobacteraceae bacterium]|nr:sugar transferase [Solirubrobacteraceae bacterium]